MVHETWHIISVDERVAFQKRSRTLLDHPGVNLREKGTGFSLSLFSLSLGRSVIIESSLTRTIFRSLAIDFFVRPSVRLFVYAIPFRVSSLFFSNFHPEIIIFDIILRIDLIVSMKRWRDSTNVLEIVSYIRRSPFSSIRFQEFQERRNDIDAQSFLKKGENRFIAGARIRTFLIRVYKFPPRGGLISFGPLVIRD